MEALHYDYPRYRQQLLEGISKTRQLLTVWIWHTYHLHTVIMWLANCCVFSYCTCRGAYLLDNYNRMCINKGICVIVHVLHLDENEIWTLARRRQSPSRFFSEESGLYIWSHLSCWPPSGQFHEDRCLQALLWSTGRTQGWPGAIQVLPQRESPSSLPTGPWAGSHAYGCCCHGGIGTI